MTTQTGTFFWMEHYSRDLKAAQAFYEKTAGWTFEAVPMPEGAGEYVIARAGETMVAGFVNTGDFPGMEEVPSHWLSYIAVDDVDRFVKAAQEAGGTITKAAFDIPGVGRMAVTLDVTGAVVAVMKPSE